MAHLIEATEKHRVESEADAYNFIAVAKESTMYDIKSTKTVHKCTKADPDGYWLVTITKIFTDEKEPDRKVSVSYRN